MSIPDNRLSTELVDAPYIFPENIRRSSLLHDIEGGPIGVLDTSEGMNYQKWELTYINDFITITPELTGSSFTFFNAIGITQASFCFDQNARANLVYKVNDAVVLYWYDSSVAEFVYTVYQETISGILSLDDKRDLQIGANDILFWYTKETSPNVYTLYHRRQRDRFTIEYLMKEDVPPYLWKAGMHTGLRGKITLTYRNS